MNEPEKPRKLREILDDAEQAFCIHPMSVNGLEKRILSWHQEEIRAERRAERERCAGVLEEADEANCLTHARMLRALPDDVSEEA